MYTGSGGRPRNGGDHLSDQEFQRGNLALAYSCNYDVESSAYGPGKSGREVCQFKLVRLPGQDALGSNTWRSARDLTDALVAKIRPPGYLTMDMSKGKEAVPIPVRNTVDQDVSPLEFEYLVRPEFPAPPKPVRRGHKCCIYSKTACSEMSSKCAASGCACVKRSGGGGPAYSADGTLVRGRPVVYECGAGCGCPPRSCPNRVTQRGMMHRLEVFRSKETEWGVRTLDLIQPGAFLCEFTGDVLPADHPRIANANTNATGDDAPAGGVPVQGDGGGREDAGPDPAGRLPLRVHRRRASPRIHPRIANANTNASTGASMEEVGRHRPTRGTFPPRWREWGDAPAAVLPDDGEEPPRFTQCPTPGYVIDVSKRRNFAAYISHSGAPNAFVQLVVRGDEDESCPHLMVFAMETIPPMRELSIDYGVDQ
uniref:Putative histone-lysine N-methyltransferase, H3 lysine-9 specific SUVH9 n=1 Tax=Aegilops tauschii TaxID=37682 RepID=N1R4H0_AEGTA